MSTTETELPNPFFHSPSINEEFSEEYAIYMREFVKDCLNELAKRGYSPEGAVEFMTEDAAPSMFGRLTWSCAEACTFLHYKRQYQEYSLGFSLTF